MFCLDPLHPIFNAILEIVSKSPGISMGELHKELKARNVDVSLQHLYRTVTRMTDEQVLLKTKGKVSINLMWASYLQFFAEQTKAAAVDSHKNMPMFPLKEGERKVFELDTLADVETIWNHLLVQLYGITPDVKMLFKYYSHAWWQLGEKAGQKEIYKRIADAGIRCHWLFGSTSFLDTHVAEVNNKVFLAKCTDTPPFPAEGYNTNVYGEYILECIFPDNITKHFAFLFRSVKSMKEFDARLVSDLFGMKGKYKVTVWRNWRQADTVRAKIAQCFA
ncbi:MAG TPA: hypothetical protein PKV72_04785 [Candidatus Peribacteria bacterium]|nr:hypothetical protein [Candidatus Peribacteria bacterium]